MADNFLIINGKLVKINGGLAKGVNPAPSWDYPIQDGSNLTITQTYLANKSSTNLIIQ